MKEDIRIISDTMVHGLRQSVAEVDAKIASLDESRAAMLRVIQDLESGAIQPFRAESIGAATASDPPPAKALTVAEERGNAIEAVLREEGQPMHRRPIHDKVVASGLYIGRKNSLNAVSQTLTDDSRFINTDPGQGEWGLSEWYPDGEIRHPPLTRA